MNAIGDTGAQLLDGAASFSIAGASLPQYLAKHWSRASLTNLLNDPDPRVVKAGALSLALCGTMGDTAALARLLHHEDPIVVAIAEHALWSVWLRAGDETANERIEEASEAMARNELRDATRLLDEAVRRCPKFAEAYHQRATAWYLLERPLPGIADSRRALALNPWHFGAAATLGHCYAQMRLYERALEAYHAALKIHPRLEGVRQTIRQIREAMAGAVSRPSRLR